MTTLWKPTNAMREVEHRTDYIERTMAEGRPIDNGTLAHLMQAIEDYKARVAELDATVGKLPRTADGVPVVPGMTVWRPTRSKHDYSLEVDVVGKDYAYFWDRGDGFSIDASGMYETLEAAIEAFKKGS